MKKIITGDCIDRLKDLPDESVNCVVTSPPYYGLRDYGTGTWVGGDPDCPHRRTSKQSKYTITGHAQDELKGNVGDAIYKTVCPLCGAVRVDKQIGLEDTPQEYINRLVKVFRECRRVLTEDGTLWVNIGDTYCGVGGNGSDHEYKQKDIIGIPWMLAFALRDDGWYLRQDIIWAKPNPMPESVKDRCTKSHEYVFLLSKSQRYYFDGEAISEPTAEASVKRLSQNVGGQIGSYTPSKGNGMIKESMPRYKNLEQKGQPTHTMHERRADGLADIEYSRRNKRDVWMIPTQAVKYAHFATFPEKLVEPCVLAGSPKGGVVLDPFCGSGTTGIVCVRNERDFIGIELNPEYAEMSVRRIEHEESQGIQISLFS